MPQNERFLAELKALPNLAISARPALTEPVHA
jgi:hypothetical protein